MSSVRLRAGVIAAGFALAAFVVSCMPFRASALVDPEDSRVAIGDVAEDGLFASCANVIVEGETVGAVSVRGDVIVRGKVSGDASAFFGRVHVGKSGVVTGNVFALFGAVELDEGARIDGEVWSLAPMNPEERGYLAVAYSTPSLLVRLVFLLGWIGSALLAAFLAPASVAQAAAELVRHPGRLLSIGVLVSLSLLLSCVFAVALIQVFVGIPLLILLVLFWACLAGVASASVFHAVGERLTERFGQGSLTGYAVLLAGALLFGLIHFLPVVGEMSFILATSAGAAAVLATRFGRRQPSLLSHA